MADVSVDVQFTIRDFEDEAVGVRSIIEGVDPYILIEPVDGEDDVESFSLNSTGISKEELVWALEAIAHTLKNGEITL